MQNKIIIISLFLFFALTSTASAANRYWVGGGLTPNWDEATLGITNWGTASNTQDNASVPGAADDVIFDNSTNGNSPSTLSADITINSLNMSAYTNTWTHNNTIVLTVDGNGVNFTLGSGMTYVRGGAGSRFTFSGTSGTTLITTAGHETGDVFFTGLGGSWQLQDALTVNDSINLTRGTFDANDFNVTMSDFSSSNSNVRTLAMGNGIWTLTAGNTTVWNIGTNANLTLNEESSTIKLTGTTGGTLRAFIGGSNTYNNYWSALSGSKMISMEGSNTFNDFKIDAGVSQLFTAGTTTTVTTFTASGTTGNLVEIKSVTASAHTLTTASPQISIDYASISYSTVTQTNTWYAGANSNDNGNNTNWIFTAPPAAAAGPNNDDFIIIIH